MMENRPFTAKLGNYVRDYILVVVALIGLSLVFTQGNILAYLPILFASGIRNTFFPWIGSGALFYVVVFVGFLIEGVVITAVVRLGARLLKAGR